MNKLYQINYVNYTVDDKHKSVVCQMSVSIYFKYIFKYFNIKTDCIDIKKLFYESQIDLDFAFDKNNRFVISRFAHSECSENDSFDINVGKKIAYIKASKKIFKTIRNIFNRISVYTENIYMKSNKCVLHFDKMLKAEQNYLNKICSK